MLLALWQVFETCFIAVTAIVCEPALMLSELDPDADGVVDPPLVVPET